MAIKGRFNIYYNIMLFMLTTGFLINSGISAMEITSTDFKANQSIPVIHTCDGQDLSPQLSWSGIPEGTKSLALSCIDPDAPRGDFIHWLVYDIPTTTKGIAQSGPLPSGAREVLNDFGKKEYGGPCPPSGTHHYFFTIYALKIEKLGDVSKENFLKKVKDNALTSAQIVGFYKRR